MEDWTKEIWTFCTDVVTEIEDVVQDLTHVAAAISHEIEEMTPADWEQFMEELWSEITEPQNRTLADWLNDDDLNNFTTVDWVAPPPTCQGCVNYHGHVYNKNLLVCAIHPHGKGDAPCPDWQGQ
ncbi:MAG: hypothetical protein EA366_16075 [Spirulina sp. DLM2.Bin59]|nr:MAG: hypothetical protein EA366_16075 [Spirulina sp. DLM2.Bin59]